MKNDDIVALNTCVDLEAGKLSSADVGLGPGVYERKAYTYKWYGMDLVTSTPLSVCRLGPDEAPPPCARKGCDESALGFPDGHGCCSVSCAIGKVFE